MEAHGSDGDIAANDSHVTILWKTLRGRLSSKDGASLEIIPISRIFETVIVPATESRKGCIQFHIIGMPKDSGSELSWMSSLHKGQLNQTVMFTLPMQFEFQALADYIENRIKILRTQSPAIGDETHFASGA